ncbi:3-hydroxy-3-methylglutaryl-coenzyme A reductase [Planifilum fimeticola]|jgi:hydroxymethylglutaryl-CoA reductase|uniref:3-hydroxy-3-methylglutaryl coenzyme A reductase n=1 Tax=Planifilum fimeticola TaxID=201975 RepID=A0A2T0LAK7_9BACL|nr:hydroxymethylglutaryl-CoA reductase, degradative [Planifilum fimeticola]PRX38807.1 3-hydroxy-3-methylglutaryl-coenzyme A reductase [Planifilum fimeticola]
MGTRFKGFYRLSPEERLDNVAEHSGLSGEEKAIIRGEKGFSVQTADQMVENVIGYMPIPLGVAANFKVDGRDIFVPMATEEPSVIAAASNAARLAYDTGGFTTSFSGPIMIGQVHVTQLSHPYAAMAKIYENKEAILNKCNQQDPTLISLGGGALDLEVRVVKTLSEKVLVIHLFVDTRDAMGANAVNTMNEAVAPLIEKITGGKVVLRILSNLADKRIARARAVFESPFGNDKEMLHRFISAYELAAADPYRAATHNKGIMNGVSAVVLATGNDTRAVEAGAHAYAARFGRYTTLTHYELGENRTIIGTIELPLAVGLVGGATKSHPVARTAIKMLGVKTSRELAGIIAAVGLAQNFAALRALASEGIQKGHMKLHAKNMAIQAGAKGHEIGRVVEWVVKEGRFRFDDIKRYLEKIREE